MTSASPSRISGTETTPSSIAGRARLDNGFARLTSGVAQGAVVVLMLRTALHAVSPLSNPDTFFHLRMGHEFWGDWSIASPGSMTRFAKSPWVPTQWSTEMLMAKVEDWFGLPGVAWLFGACYLVLLLAVYFVCRRRADQLVSAVVTGAVFIGASGSLSARPQVLSLIFLVFIVAAWVTASGTIRPPWLLVPLTWVWATVHGFWSAGVLLGVVVVVGTVLDRPGQRRAALRLLWVPVLSTLAAALTPVGPRLLLSQLAVAQRSSMISEWAPTSFRAPDAFVVAVMAAAVVVLWARRGSATWTQLLMFLLACWWAMMANRMVALSAIVIAPLLASALAELKPLVSQSRRSRRSEHAALLTSAALILAAMAGAVPHTANQPGGVPDRFAARLEALSSGSNVLVADPVGSWIEWRFPTLNPTFDGMLDAYDVAYLKRLTAAASVQPGWRGFVHDTHADVAVLVKGSALSAAMHDELHWRPVQRDGQWVYLVAPKA